mmetsp:Transcript_28656/g.37556  ORF Transcript_28656/g.37556 Transcript_28656/m.37556 type:complete len:339 (+) Transcript_28656:211-1227(+)
MSIQRKFLAVIHRSGDILSPSIARCEEPKKELELEKLPDIAAEEKPELVKQAEIAEKGPEEKIKCPGQYENIHNEVRRLTTMIDVWDGVRFDMNKPVTPTFAINHLFWLGTSMVPGHVHYTYGATVAEDSDRLIMGRIDLNGTLDSRIHYGWTKKLNSKFLLMMGQQEMLSADLCYDGDNCSMQGKLATGPANTFSFAYIQALTPRLSMGGEGQMDFTSKMTALSGIVKYGTPQYLSMLTVAQGGQAVMLHYLRYVVKDRVTLGAELVMQPMSLQSNVALGAVFKLKQSNFVTAIDGTGKVVAVLETALSPACKLSFSGEMTYLTDQYKFGYGLSIGG